MDFKLLKKLYRKAMSRKAAAPVIEKPEQAARLRPVILPLDPPFIDEGGDYDAKRATAWAKDKLRPNWFHRSKFMMANHNGEQTSGWTSRTYERPDSDKRLKGKLKIKAAKRAKVRLMKTAQV